MDIWTHSDLDQTSDISILENAENNSGGPEVRKVPVQKLEINLSASCKSMNRPGIGTTDLLVGFGSVSGSKNRCFRKISQVSDLPGICNSGIDARGALT